MPLKILYLDDEPEMGNIFVDEFSSPDLEIKIFSDVHSFVLFAQTYPADLIFLDYRLPGTTGDRIALALPPDTPKYLISGDVSVKTEYSFDGVFEKPYCAEDIFKLLRFWVTRKAG